jgi:hypothetical protein
MASIPELLNGHITLEVECLDRLYLNGYIGRLATAGGLVTFMRDQLGKPIPSPVVLGQVTEKFREAVNALAQRQQIPLYAFAHKEKKDDVANRFRRQRGTRDGIVFIGVAQEKAKAFHGKKVNGQFQFDRSTRPRCATPAWRKCCESSAKTKRRRYRESLPRWVRKPATLPRAAGPTRLRCAASWTAT